MSENDADHGRLLELTANIVAAHVSNNHVPGPELPATIEAVYGQLAGLGAPVVQPPEELKPAVPIKKSVTDDHIICLEDGKQLKMLKRHLSTAFNMTPDEYRARWGCPTTIPWSPQAMPENVRSWREDRLGKEEACTERTAQAGLKNAQVSRDIVQYVQSSIYIAIGLFIKQV